MLPRTDDALAPFLLVSLLAFIFLPNSSCAQVRNLALQAPYEWSPAPNYAACSEADDIRQLTDGHRLNDVRGFVKKDMVGWSLPAGSRMLLTLDLGMPCEIHEIVISTRQAADSQVLPPSVVVASSLDGETFLWAGAYDSRGFRDHPLDGAHKVDVRIAFESSRNGRWVHLIFTTMEDFLFMDEIEVLGLPSVAGAVVSALAATTDSSATTISETARFRRSDSDALARQQRRLWAVRSALPDSLPADLLYPQATLHTEESARFARRGRLWQDNAALGAAAIGMRRVDAWAVRHPWSEPGAEVQDTLQVSSGTWSALAVDVWSIRDTTLLCQAIATQPTLGTTLRSAVAVEARNETWRDDALPLLTAPLSLQAGQSKQLWIDVDATATAPGIFSVQVRCGTSTVQVAVRVQAAIRSAEPPLATFNFTYPTTRPILQDQPLAAIRDNRAALINSWIMERSAVPWPRRAAIDAAGNRQEPVDFGACDARLQLYAQDGESWQLGWYWNFWIENEDPSGGRFEHVYFSDAWKRAVSQWLHEWTQHLQANGYPLQHTFMLPVDERGNKRVRDLYRYLKSIAPQVRLAATLSRGQSQRELRALLPWLDIAILNRDILRDSSAFIERMHEKGSEVWVYAVLTPAKASSPTESYRMLAWEAWALGLQGCAFWSYAHVAGDSWDDFDGDHPDFSVVYVNNDPASSATEAFVPSRRWRAFRMGLQDVQRFAAMARDLPSVRQEVDTAIQETHLRAALLRRSFVQ